MTMTKNPFAPLRGIGFALIVFALVFAPQVSHA
jgi:hypothetical protein